MELTKKQKTWSIVIGVIVVMSIIGQFAPQKPKPVERIEYGNLTATAQTCADGLLKQQLKFPDGWSYEYKDMQRTDSVTYSLKAIVLAKNGFGVRSRINYTCVLKYTGSKEVSNDIIDAMDSRYWTVISNTLGE